MKKYITKVLCFYLTGIMLGFASAEASGLTCHIEAHHFGGSGGSADTVSVPPGAAGDCLRLPDLPPGIITEPVYGKQSDRLCFHKKGQDKESPIVDLPVPTAEPLWPELPHSLKSTVDLTVFDARKGSVLIIEEPEGQQFNLWFYRDADNRQWFYPEKLAGTDIEPVRIFTQLPHRPGMHLLVVEPGGVSVRELPVLAPDDEALPLALSVHDDGILHEYGLLVLFRDILKEWRIKMLTPDGIVEMTLEEYRFWRQQQRYQKSLNFESMLAATFESLPDFTRGWNTPGAMIPAHKIRQTPGNEDKNKKTKKEDHHQGDAEPKQQAASLQVLPASIGQTQTIQASPGNTSKKESARSKVPKSLCVQISSGRCPAQKLKMLFENSDLTPSYICNGVDILSAALTAEFLNPEILSFLLTQKLDLFKPALDNIPPIIRILNPAFDNEALQEIRKSYVKEARLQLSHESDSAHRLLSKYEYSDYAKKEYVGTSLDRLLDWLTEAEPCSDTSHDNRPLDSESSSARGSSVNSEELFISADEGDCIAPIASPPSASLPSAENGQSVWDVIWECARNNLSSRNINIEKLYTILNQQPDKHLLTRNDRQKKTSPLGMACQCGNYEVARAFLRYSEFIHDEKDMDDTPILSLPAGKGFSMICDLLLENGATPNLENGRRENALLQAIKHEQKDSVNVLLENGANTHAGRMDGLDPLQYSQHKLMEAEKLIENAIIHQALLRACPDTAVKLNKLVHEKNPEVLKAELKKACFVPLGFHGVHDLIAQSVEPDDNLGRLKVWLDSPIGHLILDSRDEAGNSLLMLASQQGARESAALIVSKQATCIDWQNRNGDTALMLAIQCRQEEMINWLLKSGASVIIRNESRRNASELVELVFAGDPEVLKRVSDRLDEASRWITESTDPIVHLLARHLDMKRNNAATKHQEKKSVEAARKTLHSALEKHKASSDEESTRKKELDRCYKRIADLETRIHDLTLQQNVDIPSDIELVHLDRHRIEEEYLKIKELKRKAEQYAVEAKQTAQRLSAENHKLREDLSKEKHFNELTHKSLLSSFEESVNKCDSAEPKIKILMEEIARLKKQSGQEGASMATGLLNQWEQLPKARLLVSSGFSPQALRSLTALWTENHQNILPGVFRLSQQAQWQEGELPVRTVSVINVDPDSSPMTPIFQTLTNYAHCQVSAAGGSGDPDPHSVDHYIQADWSAPGYGLAYPMLTAALGKQQNWQPKKEDARLLSGLHRQGLAVLARAFSRHSDPEKAFERFKRQVSPIYIEGDVPMLKPNAGMARDWKKEIGYYYLTEVSELASAVLDVETKTIASDSAFSVTETIRPGTAYELNKFSLTTDSVIRHTAGVTNYAQAQALGNPSLLECHNSFPLNWDLRKTHIPADFYQSYKRLFLRRHQYHHEKFDHYRKKVQDQLPGSSSLIHTLNTVQLSTENVPAMLFLETREKPWFTSPVMPFAPNLDYILLPWLDGLVSMLAEMTVSVDQAQGISANDFDPECSQAREHLIECVVGHLTPSLKDILLSSVKQRQTQVTELAERPMDSAYRADQFADWRRQIAENYNMEQPVRSYLNEAAVEQMIKGGQILNAMLQEVTHARPLIRQLSAAALAALFGESLDNGWQLLLEMEYQYIDISHLDQESGQKDEASELAYRYFFAKLYDIFSYYFSEKIQVNLALLPVNLNEIRKGTEEQKKHLQTLSDYYEVVRVQLLHPLAQNWGNILRRNPQEIEDWLIRDNGREGYSGAFVDWFTASSSPLFMNIDLSHSTAGHSSSPHAAQSDSMRLQDHEAAQELSVHIFNAAQALYPDDPSNRNIWKQNTLRRISSETSAITLVLAELQNERAAREGLEKQLREAVEYLQNNSNRSFLGFLNYIDD